MKKCSKCGILQNSKEFRKHSETRDGLDSMCKECHRAASRAWKAKNKDRVRKALYQWIDDNREHHNKYQRDLRRRNPDKVHARHIKYKYGCDKATYEALLIKQESKCAICRTEHKPTIKFGKLYVDHCHKSGLIRGLLCTRCNALLGYAKDDSGLLIRASSYLDEIYDKKRDGLKNSAALKVNYEGSKESD